MINDWIAQFSMNPLATKNRKHPKNLPQIQILLCHKTIARTHLCILHHLHLGLVFVHRANTSVKVEAHKVLGFQQNQMLQSFVVECSKEFSQTNGCMIGLGGSKSLTLTCSMGFHLRTDSLTNQVFLASSTNRSNGGSLQLSCFQIRSM